MTILLAADVAVDSIAFDAIAILLTVLFQSRSEILFENSSLLCF